MRIPFKVGWQFLFNFSFTGAWSFIHRGTQYKHYLFRITFNLPFWYHKLHILKDKVSFVTRHKSLIFTGHMERWSQDEHVVGRWVAGRVIIESSRGQSWKIRGPPSASGSLPTNWRFNHPSIAAHTVRGSQGRKSNLSAEEVFDVQVLGSPCCAL